MSSAYENAMSDGQANNYTQRFPVVRRCEFGMCEAEKLEAERDEWKRRHEALTMTSRALEQHQKTRAELIETVDALRRENKALLDALSEIKRILAVGRNVGEDKDQAYEDAEEIADVTSDYYRSGQAQQ